MPDTLAPAIASLEEVQLRVACCAADGPAFYTTVSSAQSELGRFRGALALFMADDHDDSVSANSIGFAQNVAHAADGLDRALAEAAKAALALTVAKRDFAAQIRTWQDAAQAPPEPVSPAPG